MKNKTYKNSVITLLTATIILISSSCEREMEGLQLAEFPTTGEVFIDGFSAGLGYEAWGDVSAFDVDKEIKYSGEASMKFAVPDEGETGGFAGGRFVTAIPRDLSGYDALTFWAKASKAASIDKIGFGNNAQGSKYQAALNGVKVNTNWKKIIIPIPNPSKLTSESGMLFYSESPEEGSGYTFWIDEVKFEKLGTIAHQQPAILNGEDKVSTAFNNVSIPIAGLSFIANLPNGVNQSVEVASSYFTFTSSDSNVATVDENGIVSVLSSGTAVIKGGLGNLEAAGSLTVESSGEFVHAPTPTIGADSVISIFSNSYTNAPVEYYNGYWQPYQTTLSADFNIGGNDVLNYTNLNFVGIQFSTPTINASGMTHLHLDVFIPNEVASSDKLKITLIDMGADGTFDDPNPSVSYTLEGASITSKSWISVDLNLSALGSKTKLAQIIFENLGSQLSGFYADNIYLYNDGTGTGGSGGDMPAVAAPTPTQNATDVISIYGDAYTNLEGTDYPDWGQTTQVSDISIGGDNALKLAGLNYQGVQLANSLDVSEMKYLHIDYWTNNSTALNVYLISSGPAEKAYTLTVPTTGWSSVNIPLSAFSEINLADVIQLKYDGNGDIYLDNVYFYTDNGSGSTTQPTVAAPTPTKDAADVISIFSDAYTNLEGTDYPDWGQTTQVSDTAIAENNTLKFAGLNFQGVQLANNLDVSGMNYLHIDYWTENSRALNVFLISPGPVEKGYALTVPTAGWSSVDIPLSAFSSVDLANVIQLKYDGNGNIYLDNIYFYKSGGSAAGEPTSAASTPPARDAADVISLFSNTYTNETVDTWSADWDDSDVADFQVAGDDMKKYTFTNFAGIDFSSNKLDASEMTRFHMDIWTPNEVISKSLTIKCVDFGGGSAEASSLILTLEHTPKGDIPALATGTWVSIDVPVSAFTGNLTKSDLAQLVLSSNLSTVYIDNLYFYRGSGGGGGATEPTGAAPTPTEDASGVISVFSDAYTDIANTNFDPDWGQSTDASIVAISGNDVLKYANLNYQGINIGGADGVEQDISAKGYLHVDYWAGNATALNLFLISTGPLEKSYTLTVPTNGSWASVDIPLSAFTSVVDLTKVFQLKIEGNGDVYLDNIYFHGEAGSTGGGGGDTAPTAAAPTPPARDAANVVSIYSDVYTDIAVDNFDAGWCGGAAVTGVTVAGNNTLKKNAGIDCHGIDFSLHRQDLSSYTHIHFDFYTDDTDLTGDVFNIKLVDFAGGSGEASALEVNINTGTTPKIVAGSWVSVDIDITSLGGIVTNNLTRSDVAQIGITTANLTNVWYDNIYFYK